MNRLVLYSFFFLISFLSFAQPTSSRSAEMRKKIMEKLNQSEVAEPHDALSDTNNVWIEDDSIVQRGYFYLGSNDVFHYVANQEYDDWYSEATSETEGNFQLFFEKVNNPRIRKILSDSLYWRKIEYTYRIFDTITIDPYRIDPSSFKDSVEFDLFGKNFKGKELGWSMPLNKIYVTSQFGPRWNRWHYGTDFGIKIGDSVLAAFDGVVRVSRSNPTGYGNFIIVRHDNGLESLYGHLQKSVVEVGQVVKAGELIGVGGNSGRSTGPHLHFELRYQGNAFNTEVVFDYKNDTIRDQRFVLYGNHFRYSTRPVSSAPVAKKSIYHRVRKGETLSTIASKYHVSVAQIRKLNRLGKSSVIRAGRTLRIR